MYGLQSSLVSRVVPAPTANSGLRRSVATLAIARPVAEFVPAMSMSRSCWSNHSRAFAAAMSALCWWSATSSSLLRPSISPPISAIAIRIASTPPGPSTSAYTPPMSVMNPIRITSPEYCASAGWPPAIRAAAQSVMERRRIRVSSGACVSKGEAGREARTRCVQSRRSAQQVFHEDGHPHSAAETHADDAVAAAGLGQVMQGGDRHPDPGRAGRMPDRDAASVQVGLLSSDAELRLGMQVHDRERLVDLEIVDVADRQGVALEQLADRGNGPRTHDLGRNAGDRVVDERGFGSRLGRQRVAVGDDQRCRTAGHAARVAGRHRAARLERRPQRGELLARRVETGELVALEQARSAAAVGHGDRRDLACEKARLDRRTRALLA